MEKDSHFTRALLLCGIMSSVWYVAINIFVPFFWPDYSILHHTVSELSAIDAPTRTLWIILASPYIFLFAAFGWGMLRSAKENRSLFIMGWVILVYCMFNLYWPPMHLREVLASGGGTLTDTLHLVWAGITTALFLLIMILGAAGMSTPFRIYTGVSAIFLLLFGTLTSLAAPNLASHLPTPWIGVYERINIGVFLLWVVVLGILRIQYVHSKD